jgi:hypothetical protein
LLHKLCGACAALILPPDENLNRLDALPAFDRQHHTRLLLCGMGILLTFSRGH